MPTLQDQDAPQEPVARDQALSVITELLTKLQMGFVIWRLEGSVDNPVPKVILSNLGADASRRIAGERILNKLACLEDDLREVAQTGKLKNLGPIERGDEDLSEGIFAVKIIPLPDQCVAVAFEMTRAHPKITHAIERQAKLIDLANDAILVLELDGTIACWNEGAERMYGWLEAEAVGQSLLSLLAPKFPKPFAEISEALFRAGHWKGEILHKKKGGTFITVSSHWTMERDAAGKPLGWLQIDTDMTEQKQTEESLRKLSTRLLGLQDEERRRIARELHDSTAQTLSALALGLATLQTGKLSGPKKAARILQECRDLSDRASQEIRNLSHLLHPPDLDTMGLLPAVRWHAIRFSELTGIQVDLDLPQEPVLLPPHVKLAFFRVVQESLNNIRQHSGSHTARVLISLGPEEATLQIQDRGHGMRSADAGQAKGTETIGVGIAGMRARLRQLGGRLEIESTDHGTSVTAVLPLKMEDGPSASRGDPL
ncbi:MAG: PAS domain-containing sensor histidine kinase [Terriglobia bacterium]